MFPIFEENEFSFNNADVIINLIKVSYIYIQEGVTLTISCNSAKSNAIEQRSLIVFSKDINNYLCRFQFLLNKGRLDQDTKNNTINVSLIFQNNHNYTGVLWYTIY